MNWAPALMVVIAVAVFVPWLFSEVASRFGGGEERHDHDWLADRKRKLEKRGYRTRMGVKQ